MSKQKITAEAAQRILTEFEQAKRVMEWLQDNKLIPNLVNIDALATDYACRHSQLHRAFLNQFEEVLPNE